MAWRRINILLLSNRSSCALWCGEETRSLVWKSWKIARAWYSWLGNWAATSLRAWFRDSPCHVTIDRQPHRQGHTSRWPPPFHDGCDCTGVRAAICIPRWDKTPLNSLFKLVPEASGKVHLMLSKSGRTHDRLWPIRFIHRFVCEQGDPKHMFQPVITGLSKQRKRNKQENFMDRATQHTRYDNEMNLYTGCSKIWSKHFAAFLFFSYLFIFWGDCTHVLTNYIPLCDTLSQVSARAQSKHLRDLFQKKKKLFFFKVFFFTKKLLRKALKAANTFDRFLKARPFSKACSIFCNEAMFMY